MSKRKNTLTDLEEFLKLQASTLVTPLPVEPAKMPESPKPEFIAQDILPKEVYTPPIHTSQPVDLLAEMKKMANQNKSGFYDLVIQTMESLPTQNSQDLLLINTALYLKHGNNWKAGIEDYWIEKKKVIR